MPVPFGSLDEQFFKPRQQGDGSPFGFEHLTGVWPAILEEHSDEPCPHNVCGFIISPRCPICFLRLWLCDLEQWKDAEFGIALGNQTSPYLVPGLFFVGWARFPAPVLLGVHSVASQLPGHPWYRWKSESAFFRWGSHTSIGMAGPNIGRAELSEFS